MYRLELHETPPSLNRFGSVGGGTYYVYRRLKKEWHQTLATALMAARVPRGLVKVEASATMRFPTRRRRDEGNFRWLLEKVLGDTLVEGGWLPDDNAGIFTFGKVTFDPEVGEPLTVILLEVEECYSCGDPGAGSCSHSKRSCGHHCNCSWVHDRCHWCGAEFGEDELARPRPRQAAAAVTANTQRESEDQKRSSIRKPIRWRRRVKG